MRWEYLIEHKHNLWMDLIISKLQHQFQIITETMNENGGNIFIFVHNTL